MAIQMTPIINLNLSIADMHVNALNLNDVDISTRDGASAAMSKIKTAINTVSTSRGKLGAIQNRLEHTINNLGVTTENITSAESRIRDVDMAKEMMNYTKEQRSGSVCTGHACTGESAATVRITVITVITVIGQVNSVISSNNKQII